MKTWTCKIGEVDESQLADDHPRGRDAAMREAVGRAYVELTGQEPTFLFSGWGGELDEGERAVVENREPEYLLTGWLEDQVNELRREFRAGNAAPPDWSMAQWITMLTIKLGDAASQLVLDESHAPPDEDRADVAKALELAKGMGLKNLLAVAAVALDAIEALEEAHGATKA